MPRKHLTLGRNPLAHYIKEKLTNVDMHEGFEQ